MSTEDNKIEIKVRAFDGLFSPLSTAFMHTPEHTVAIKNVRKLMDTVEANKVTSELFPGSKFDYDFTRQTISVTTTKWATLNRIRDLASRLGVPTDLVQVCPCSDVIGAMRIDINPIIVGSPPMEAMTFARLADIVGDFNLKSGLVARSCIVGPASFLELTEDMRLGMMFNRHATDKERGECAVLVGGRILLVKGDIDCDKGKAYLSKDFPG